MEGKKGKSEGEEDHSLHSMKFRPEVEQLLLRPQGRYRRRLVMMGMTAAAGLG